MFLILKQDTLSLRRLLFTLRQFYSKKFYRFALENINESITVNNIALTMIEKQLAEFENAA